MCVSWRLEVTEVNLIQAEINATDRVRRQEVKFGTA